MGVAEYSITHRTVSWVFLLILVIGGVLAFNDLGRLEDPPFKVKDALIVTAYPGASAEEVELELTHPLENTIRQLPEVHTITSSSMPGLSQIKVEMDKEMDPALVEQLWDKLRRKVEDVENALPAGARAPRIYDDYGDVYGITLMVSGEHFSFSELKLYVENLQREMELVKGVGKVSLFGEQQEQIFVEISLKKLAALNLDLHRVTGFLQQQNALLDAGRVTVDGEAMQLRLGGLGSDIDPVIHGRDSGQLVHLSDVAKVSRGFQEIPQQLIRMNGNPAITLGISFADGVNVVEVGRRVRDRLAQLESRRPAGIVVESLYDQPLEVEKSVSGFLFNLGMSVAIVIVALLLTMGWRSGLIVGTVLLLTMLGTFILMKLTGFQLHRLSLGALIVALGMLVDNAIVVVEGVLVGMARGVSKRQACYNVVRQTKWPLLAATLIAILAFTPFGLSQSDTGQIMKAMFWVLTFSLALSWITAITLTPFLIDLLLPGVSSGNDTESIRDPYQGGFYTLYKSLLDKSMEHRAIVVVFMVLLLGLSVVGFSKVKKAFFTASGTPMFYVDMWLPQGTDIRSTLDQVRDVENFVAGQAGVEFVSSSIGRGAPRFNFTYRPEQSHENYAQLQVRMTELELLGPFMRQLEQDLILRFPRVFSQLQQMEFGPPSNAKIEARLSGPNPDALRQLGDEIAAIMRADPVSRGVYTDWKERGKELVPVVNEAEARRLGISNEELSLTLRFAFGGAAVGVYRDGARKLPIVIRLPEDERVNFERITNLRLWSPKLRSYVPIQQVINRIDLQWNDTLIRRRDRQRTLTVGANHDFFSGQTAEQLFQRIRPQVEAIPLPPGYSLSWGGEYEQQQRSLKGAFGKLPLALLMMFILTVLLFNSFRQSLVIWLTVPLLVIGVAFGLLLTNMPLTFPALLGMLSLIGMILKNGIVLVDQIALELREGRETFDAVRDSAISRVRPVSMAAATTVLGMLPLVTDAFFASQAITFIFGLSFATVLTLVILPVIYLLIYRVKKP